MSFWAAASAVCLWAVRLSAFRFRLEAPQVHPADPVHPRPWPGSALNNRAADYAAHPLPAARARWFHGRDSARFALRTVSFAFAPILTLES